jgi:hypothetical protein
MGSQFVDFNDDGHLDLVTATYDGSPHVSYGSANGFMAPELILDAKGDRIMFSMHWAYHEDGSGEWMNTSEDHCISAVAFDWDNDGDYDLLLGSYDGQLFRRMNEGKKGAHRFASENIPVKAGDKPLMNEGGMTAPQLIDWNGDGLMDLVCGSFGKKFGELPSGGVYLYRNVGALGAPRFAPAETLIEPIAEKAKEFSRPDEGLYANAVDYNGDGALDLVVGAYCNYSPETRKLTAQEEARIKVLDEQTQQNGLTLRELQSKATEGAEAGTKEWTALYTKLRESKEYQDLMKKSSAARAELSELRPGPKRVPAVWLYERKK